jgi:hypothetical protein
MTPIALTEALARDLVPTPLFRRLVSRIVLDHQLDHQLAERIMTEALAFLRACGANPDVPLSPSLQVDIGWHTFILYTREYAEFCQRVAGRFIHHLPDDEDTDGADDLSGVDEAALVRQRTLAALAAAGHTVDLDLWGLNAKCEGDTSGEGKCHQCHAGCHHSP